MTRPGRRSAEPPELTGATDDVEPDPESVARAICLRLLTGAPRTRAELATALRKRGVPDEVAEGVLDRFADVNLIDDAAFAEGYVESRHRERGLARTALKHELKRKGVDEETAAAALDELDPDRERATAATLLTRKLASTKGLPPDKRTARLVGMLARKGYPAGIAYPVVRDALASEGIDPDTVGLTLDE